jgi:hypothetical protein
MTSENLTGKTTFRLVYGQEVAMTIEFILPSMHIATITDLSDSCEVEEIFS